MPAPHVPGAQLEPAGNGLALAFRKSRTWVAVRFGATDSISATTPLTSGAEKLVPARYCALSPTGTVVPLLTIVRMLYGLPAKLLPPGADTRRAAHSSNRRRGSRKR